MFWNSGCASMGYDLPAAIGAAVSQGRKDIICLAGDGSLMMNLQELAVVSYYKLPIKLFILNNDGYISIKQTQDNFFGRRYGCEPANGVFFPNFKKIAASFNIKYDKISSNVNLRNKIEKVLKMKGSLICEVVLDKNYKFAPKVSSEKLEDGTIISKPLEDMWPFLDRKEFEKESIYFGGQ